MLQIITQEEKQKCHITLFCEKNKSIILHHVLRSSPEKLSLSCGLCYSNRRIVLSYCEKRKVFFFSRTKGRVHYNTFNEQQKCHVTNIYTVEEKQKYHNLLHSFARKTKVSYYITFFQTLLKTFSCGPCHSDRKLVLSYCEERKVNYYVYMKNKRANTLQYFQRTITVSCYKYLHCRGKTKVSYYILLRAKQKYHITSHSSKLL